MIIFKFQIQIPNLQQDDEEAENYARSNQPDFDQNRMKRVNSFIIDTPVSFEADLE